MMRVRIVDRSDSRDLWEWRNDAETRAASLSTSTVEWSEHTNWFDRTIADDAKAIYVGELSDAPTGKVGMCRFDIDQSGILAEISININPEFRGKRLAAALLSGAIQAFHKDFEAVAELRALIRDSNRASQKLFTGAGFSRTSESGDDVGSYLLRLKLSG